MKSINLRRAHLVCVVMFAVIAAVCRAYDLGVPASSDRETYVNKLIDWSAEKDIHGVLPQAPATVDALGGRVRIITRDVARYWLSRPFSDEINREIDPVTVGDDTYVLFDPKQSLQDYMGDVLFLGKAVDAARDWDKTYWTEFMNGARDRGQMGNAAKEIFTQWQQYLVKEPGRRHIGYNPLFAAALFNSESRRWADLFDADGIVVAGVKDSIDKEILAIADNYLLLSRGPDFSWRPRLLSLDAFDPVNFGAGVLKNVYSYYEPNPWRKWAFNATETAYSAVKNGGVSLVLAPATIYGNTFDYLNSLNGTQKWSARFAVYYWTVAGHKSTFDSTVWGDPEALDLAGCYTLVFQDQYGGTVVDFNASVLDRFNERPIQLPAPVGHAILDLKANSAANARGVYNAAHLLKTLRDLDCDDKPIKELRWKVVCFVAAKQLARENRLRMLIRANRLESNTINASFSSRRLNNLRVPVAFRNVFPTGPTECAGDGYRLVYGLRKPNGTLNPGAQVQFSWGMTCLETAKYSVELLNPSHFDKLPKAASVTYEVTQHRAGKIVESGTKTLFWRSGPAHLCTIDLQYGDRLTVSVKNTDASEGYFPVAPIEVNLAR